MSGSGRLSRWSGAREEEEEEEGKEEEEEVGENRREAAEEEAEREAGREVEEGSGASIPSDMPRRWVKLAEPDSKSESLIIKERKILEN